MKDLLEANSENMGTKNVSVYLKLEVDSSPKHLRRLE